MAFFHLFNFLSKIGFFFVGFKVVSVQGIPQLCNSFMLFIKFMKLLRRAAEALEMRAVFLDISKAFDRVWHRGLIAKLTSIGVEGNLLNWFISYLFCRKQRLILKGVHSDWCNIEAGVPRGSVVGPLLFLVYINDLPTAITSNCFYVPMIVFLLEKVQSPADCASKLNDDLRSISDWAKRWLVTMNETKTKVIVFRPEETNQFILHLS